MESLLVMIILLGLGFAVGVICMSHFPKFAAWVNRVEADAETIVHKPPSANTP